MPSSIDLAQHCCIKCQITSYHYSYVALFHVVKLWKGCLCNGAYEVWCRGIFTDTLIHLTCIFELTFMFHSKYKYLLPLQFIQVAINCRRNGAPQAVVGFVFAINVIGLR